MRNSISKKRENENKLIELGSAALTILLGILLLISVVIFINGFSTLWPSEILRVSTPEKTYLGFLGDETGRQGETFRILEVANKEIEASNFISLQSNNISSIDIDPDAVVIERFENGKFIGYLGRVTQEWDEKEYEKYINLQDVIAPLTKQIKDFSNEIKSISESVLDFEYKIKRANYNKKPFSVIQDYENQRDELINEQDELQSSQSELVNKLLDYKINLVNFDGQVIEYPAAYIIHIIRPGEMNVFDKLIVTFKKLGDFLFEDPRESNTEGGIFPSIIGTVSLVLIMSIFAFPLGVITAVYLTEYAKNNWFTKVVRISVNNLAGIPSIVYGVFGLGFFVYGVGGFIDSVFYPERLPEPTFGTGGLLWASLTLSILTVPVVIVATEEALQSVPVGLKHSSLALGATRLQTLWRVVIPSAVPGIITGFILAISRAAGEVAPLMVTGVVKLAPKLPIDLTAPFIHADRKFMHLGFHIYDLGFQSPDSDAARPMVFLTTFILLLIVLILNFGAIYLRERMRKKLKISSI